MIKQVKRSLVLLLVAILFTLTTSYAWISLATVNKVKDINLNAIAGYGLYMSLDGQNYYEHIPKELILEEIKHLSFKDVTSSDGINFYKLETPFIASRKNVDYISLTIYFQTTSRYREIHLGETSLSNDFDNPPSYGTYVISKGKAFKSSVKFLYETDPLDYVEANEVRTYYAADAMRVSFYNLIDESIKIFDLSGNRHRGFGARFGAFDYYQIMRNELLTPPEAPETVYEFSKFDAGKPIAETYESHLITLLETDKLDSKGKVIYEGAVVMNVWLEGWDADAFDAVLADQMKMQFMFKAVMPDQTII